MSTLPDSHCLGLVDWLVIVAFAIGMLWIGWYYSRRTETTEDYLLGGRNYTHLDYGKPGRRGRVVAFPMAQPLAGADLGL